MEKSAREKYPSSQYPFSDGLCSFMDNHQEFYKALKLSNEERFVYIPLIFTSHLHSTEKESADEVIGMWYFDKDSLTNPKIPQFKQDFIINIKHCNSEFHAYVDRETHRKYPSPFVHLIREFFGKYGKGGHYYHKSHFSKILACYLKSFWRLLEDFFNKKGGYVHHKLFSSDVWMHHYPTIHDLPDEINLKALAYEIMKKATFNKNLDILIHEMIELETTYCIWQELTKDVSKKIDTYNIAPAFFQLTIYAFVEQSIISACRFFDKRSDTLTLTTLLKNAKEDASEVFPSEKKEKALAEIQSDLESIPKFRENANIIKYRHSRIAHLDLKTANNLETFLKQFPITREDFRKTLDFIGSIINKYNNFARNRHTFFEDTGAVGGLTVVMDYLEKHKNQ